MKILLFIFLLISCSCFSQYENRREIVKIDSICSLEPHLPPCLTSVFGLDISAIETSTVFLNRNSVITTTCLNDEALDRTEIVKVSVRKTIVERSGAVSTDIDIYFRNGKPFHALAKREFTNWFRKNRKYDIAFDGDNIPDKIDANTKEELKFHLEQLPDHVSSN